MIRKDPELLKNLVEQILMKVGSNFDNAHRVAEALVLSNLVGIDTHGIWHMRMYVEEIRDGEIIPNAKPEILLDTPTSSLISGNWGFGFVSAKVAMDLAIKKARDQNIAVAAIVQTGHIGRLGEYVEMADREGMISFVFAGGYSEKQQSTVPYGGAEKILHTNPLAIGIPVGDNTPIVVDFATTTLSGSKVKLAALQGKQVASGAIVDAEGNPTIDPNDFINGGAHLPFGQHKGFGIMLAIEYLGRIFAGSDSYAEGNKGGLYSGYQGISFVVMKADCFSAMSDFLERGKEMQNRVNKVKPAKEFDQVYTPGDIERKIRLDREKNGIPLSSAEWEDLKSLATEVGVSVN